jgi:hypothetical protein
MKDQLLKLIGSVLPLIVGTALGALAQSCRTHADNQTRYLDVRWHVNAELFDRPHVDARHDLTVLLDSKKIDNLSSVNVQLYNFSDLDFDNIPLFVDIQSSEAALELIQADVVGANGLPEAVQITHGPATTSVAKDVPLRFAYTLTTANRAEDDVPLMVANYLFVGSVRPTNVAVKTIKKGLEVRPFEYSHKRRFEAAYWLTPSTSTVVLITAYVVFFMGLIMFSRRNYRYTYAETVTRFKSILQEFDVPAAVAPRLVGASREILLQRTPRWLRWLSQLFIGDVDKEQSAIG